MYLYYGLAAVGPHMQKYLWWKKYLTTLQLIQFTIAVLYMSQLYLFPPAYCKVSTFLIMISWSNGAIFFVLFMNFYRNTYKKKKPV
ncbi:elongation of very long chain fatty acids protein [Trichonephila clavipes]|nr:elongation of very long chain fatty acids protein [Trichonephila clavipes]